jgi:hypothetical protein
MILYHFTDFAYLETCGTILKEGLKPSVGKQGIDLPPHGVVWLTASPTADWADESPECRIRLAIPSHDRRLVKWDKWLRKHAPDVIEQLAQCDCGFDHDRSIRNNWCYFGNVPLGMFRAVEYADPERRAEIEHAIATGQVEADELLGRGE